MENGGFVEPRSPNLPFLVEFHFLLASAMKLIGGDKAAGRSGTIPRSLSEWRDNEQGVNSEGALPGARRYLPYLPGGPNRRLGTYPGYLCP